MGMYACMYVCSLLGNYVNDISQLLSSVGTQGLQACLSLQPNVQVIPSPFSVGLLSACKAIHGDNAFLLETILLHLDSVDPRLCVIYMCM